MIFVTRRAETPIERFQVFGERCSGTNYVQALIERNFPGLDTAVTRRHNGLDVAWRYGWKHGFPAMPHAPAATLFVVVVRHPETWVQSLHRTPWHAAPALRALPLATFLRSEWQAVIDNVGLGAERNQPGWGDELQWDRHPLSGRRFANVAQLRRAKLEAHLALETRCPSAVGIRYEDARNAPQEVVAELARRLRLAASPTFRAVLDSKGREVPYTPVEEADLLPADRAFLWGELDRRMEARLGYAPFD